MQFPSCCALFCTGSAKAAVFISTIAVLTEWALWQENRTSTPLPTFSSAPQMLPAAFLLLHGSRRIWANSS